MDPITNNASSGPNLARTIDVKDLFGNALKQTQRACLSVIMPVYNEANTLNDILTLVLSQESVLEVIAIDDGSTDDSWQILEEHCQRNKQLKPIRHTQNRGKGAAIKSGLPHVNGSI